MAISSVTKGNVITTAKINEIITAANGAGVSLSVSGTTLYLKNGAGTNLSNVSVVAAALPAGTVVAFAGNPSSVPTGGFLLCNGANVSRTTYANLFAAIGTTYGTGNGSSTFTLPNMTDKFIQGSDTSGTSKSAGLPNINGSTTASVGPWNDPAGIIVNVGALEYLHTDTGTYKVSANSSTGNVNQISFNASRSNSIYGASTTVQPPAITMRYYIKY